MLDLKFISKHSKALRFDFDLKTFDECGQQLEHKTISNYLTVDQSRCSTTQSPAEERVSTFAAAHS
ncbi:hypothetical protein N9Y61_02820 [Paracoccaceae bacterium]|jgi:hypothetical protein|nr:hypothetical protein [Paracoccaceae bacterium]